QAGGIVRVVLAQILTSQVPGPDGEGNRLLIAALLIELNDPLEEPADSLCEVSGNVVFGHRSSSPSSYSSSIRSLPREPLKAPLKAHDSAPGPRRVNPRAATAAPTAGLASCRGSLPRH